MNKFYRIAILITIIVGLVGCEPPPPPPPPPPPGMGPGYLVPPPEAGITPAPLYGDATPIKNGEEVKVDRCTDLKTKLGVLQATDASTSEINHMRSEYRNAGCG